MEDNMATRPSFTIWYGLGALPITSIPREHARLLDEAGATMVGGVELRQFTCNEHVCGFGAVVYERDGHVVGPFDPLAVSRAKAKLAPKLRRAFRSLGIDQAPTLHMTLTTL